MLIDLFAQRWRATLLILAMLILCGMYSYSKISKESAPNVNLPLIRVFVKNIGISPEDAEIKIIKPLENGFRSIEGLKRMRSYAISGGGEMILEFHSGFDSDYALREVRSKAQDNEYKLPSKAEKPVISSLDAMFHHTISVVLSGDVPQATLYDAATFLKDRIKAIAAVREVDMKRDDMLVEVVLNRGKAEKYGLSITDIARKISENNRMIFSDAVITESGNHSVNVPMLVKDARNFADLPVGKSGHKVIKVSDIADVRYGVGDRAVIEHANGKPAVLLDVSKQAGKSIINLVHDVKQVVSHEMKGFPSNINVTFMEDESEGVRETMSDLENGIILAGILVILVIMFSIGGRPSLLIFISIPASFLSSILIFYMSGVTLNIVVLFSLILTVGMVVDDAIVVGEYAKHLMSTSKISPMQAFCDAAKRMFVPILSATVIKMIAFVPLLFWPGLLGQFMMYMPITVIVVLGSSLIFALLFQPALGVVLYRKYDNTSIDNTGESDSFAALSKMYEKILIKATRHPKTVFAMIFAVLICIYFAFGVSGLGVEFFPEVEPERLVMKVKADGNFSVKNNNAIVSGIEKKLDSMKSEISVVHSKTLNRDAEIATFKLELVNWSKRRKAKDIISDLRQAVRGIDGVEIQIFSEQGGPKGSHPIAFEIMGSSDKIEGVADSIIEFMKQDGAFIDIDDSRPFAGVEWNVMIDREKAEHYDVNIEDIAAVVQGITNGYVASFYRDLTNEDEIRVVIRYPQKERVIHSIFGVNVKNRSGKMVPMHLFAQVKAVQSSSVIRRYNGSRSIEVLAGLVDGAVLDQEVRKLESWLKKNTPPGVAFAMNGDIESQNESGAFLVNAFGLAIMLMFVIMLFQFNSLYHTFVIMSAAFLSTTGVLLGLLVSLQPFGIVMCGLGVIALLGLVLNNNILIVDTYQKIRREGYSSTEAAIMAAKQRVRPVMLTAITAILGLLPLIIGLTINFVDRSIVYDAPSSQWWRQLSASIAGGLAFATMLSLLLTPVLLSVGGKFDRFLIKKQ